MLYRIQGMEHGDHIMKKLFSILIVLILFSAGCSSHSDPVPDPLADFRRFSTDLRQLLYDQHMEAGRGLADLPENSPDKEDYIRALADMLLSKPYFLDTYNSVINFEILTFSDDIYTNTDGDMTIDASNDQYVFDTDYFIIIENNLEKVSVQFIYNPKRQTWLLIGKRGGIPGETPPGDIEPSDLWIKQEGAAITRSTYYESTTFYIAEEADGTTHTTNSILTYGTSATPAFSMAGEQISCAADCIDETDTRIFTNGITSSSEEWEDFKFHGITTIAYEINVNQ